MLAVAMPNTTASVGQRHRMCWQTRPACPGQRHMHVLGNATCSCWSTRHVVSDNATRRVRQRHTSSLKMPHVAPLPALCLRHLHHQARPRLLSLSIPDGASSVRRRASAESPRGHFGTISEPPRDYSGATSESLRRVSRFLSRAALLMPRVALLMSRVALLAKRCGSGLRTETTTASTRRGNKKAAPSFTDEAASSIIAI